MTYLSSAISSTIGSSDEWSGCEIMSKGYVKDSNGKYRLVDRREVLTIQEPENSR